ncbi:hypothetical protein MCOR02_001139 [Pyricularia oryzae]|nr:hypothetical protein MCOR02_001139 [Pyricularia oryzae]
MSSPASDSGPDSPVETLPSSPVVDGSRQPERSVQRSTATAPANSPRTPANVRRAAGSNVLEGDSDDEEYAAPEQRVPACLPCIKSSRITGILDCRPHPAGAACNRCSRYKKSLCDHGEELHARNPLLRRRLHDLQRTMDGGRHIASPKVLATRDANNKIIQSGHNAKMTDEFNLAHAAYMREYDRLRDAEASGATSGLGGPNALSLVHRSGGSKAAQQLTIGLAQGLKYMEERNNERHQQLLEIQRESAAAQRETNTSHPCPCHCHPSASRAPPSAVPACSSSSPPAACVRPSCCCPSTPPRPLRAFRPVASWSPSAPAPAAQAPARDPPSPSVLAMFRQDARRRPQQEPAARPVAAAQAPVAPPRPAAAPQLRVRYDKDAPEYREYYESDPREYDQYEDGQYD